MESGWSNKKPLENEVSGKLSLGFEVKRCHGTRHPTNLVTDRVRLVIADVPEQFGAFLRNSDLHGSVHYLDTAVGCYSVLFRDRQMFGLCNPCLTCKCQGTQGCAAEAGGFAQCVLVRLAEESLQHD